jgi:hypothetical protein
MSDESSPITRADIEVLEVKLLERIEKTETTLLREFRKYSITTAAKAAAKPTAKVAAKDTALAGAIYQQRVVASKKVAPNGFYSKLQALAAKPITLQALVGKALAANKFTSKQEHSMVARVRTRHALTRFGYLRRAK